MDEILRDLLDQSADRTTIHMSFNPTFGLGPPLSGPKANNRLDLLAWEFALCFYHSVAVARSLKSLKTVILQFDDKVAVARFRIPLWVKQAMDLPLFTMDSVEDWWKIGQSAFIEDFTALSNEPIVIQLCAPNPPDADLILDQIHPVFLELPLALDAEFEQELEINCKAHPNLLDRINLVWRRWWPEEILPENAEFYRENIAKIATLHTTTQCLARVILAKKRGWSK